MNREKDPILLAEELRQFFASNGCAGSTSIAKMTKIGQPQVHRNLFGRPKRVTRTLKKLCEYANISYEDAVPEPASSTTLMKALSIVWDGSEEHARRLAAMLFAHKRACM